MARAADSAASFPRCCTPRRPPEPMASSSRRIRIPSGRRPTDPTWCRSTSSPELSASRSRSGSGRGRGRGRGRGGRRRCVRKLAPASERLVERGKRVLALEADAVRQLGDNLDVAFARAVEILAAAKGRVIVSGVGKSGLIARKIAATFTSTGTPAMFLHPVDSPHGRQATVVLDASVTEEACPETLAPTASTTVALALGDALAVTLLEVKGFRREDF